MKFLKCFLIAPLFMLFIIIVLGSVACFVSWSFEPVRLLISNIMQACGNFQAIRGLIAGNLLISLSLWGLAENWEA